MLYSGRQHLRTIQVCSCEEEAVTLLRYNLWPSSPKHPRLAFHTDLLRSLNGLLLECQVSVKGFCESLKSRQPKLYKILVTKEVCFDMVYENMHSFLKFIYRQLSCSVQYIFDILNGQFFCSSESV